MKKLELDFLRELSALLIKYEATIATFEGEFLIELKDGDLWLDNTYRVDKDSIDYLIRKYPLTPDECLSVNKELEH